MTQFLNSKEDCQWLLETHLAKSEDVPVFTSFIIEGNEDCPVKLDLYTDQEPLYTDKPAATFVYDDFAYIRIN